MATVTEIKSKILNTMNAMDIDKMNLMDLSAYVDILRRVADISEKSYMETLMETVKGGFNSCRTPENANAFCTGYGLAADAPAGGE